MSEIEFEAARQIVCEQLPALSPASERVPLLRALGRATVGELRSDRALPPYDRVTMDGYAVCAADTASARPESPQRLRVVGAAYPGALAPAVGAGECVRAMTGAALPRGADAVVAVENTNGYDDRLAQILSPVSRGQNISRAGEDVAAGALLVPSGTRLTSLHVQALAATGQAEIEVGRLPRAVAFSTGDELVAVTARPGPLQIRESNTQTIRALLGRAGIECADGGILPDRADALRQAIAAALQEHELVVLSGGVSKGERDHVKSVLRELGVQLHFTNLKLRPGHPTTFGTHRAGAVLALPGNPVAVVATLTAVFGPGLRHWIGVREEPRREWAQLGFAHRRRGERLQLLPVALRAQAAALPLALGTDFHGSGDFVSLLRAHGFLVLPSDRQEFAAGDILEWLRAEI